MISPILQAKIYSTLGNSSSLVPLAIKDVTNSIGLTAGSFVTGKEEGTDRFIDEFGTEALWLLGIPAYKGLFNLTCFMPKGLDYNFDARNLRNPLIQNLVKKYAPEELKENIDNVIKKQKLYKKLATAKFGVSVGLAIATYIGLTKFKQHYTDKNIRENILEEYAEAKKAKSRETSDKQVTQAPEITPPTFKGLGKVVQDFACDPVKNMWLLDGGITTERIVDSRGSQERWGYVLKEGSFLFFMYYFGDKLQEMLENRAKKVYDKTIRFDARVIENPEFRKAFEENKVAKDLEAFKTLLDKINKPTNIPGVKTTIINPELFKEAQIYEFIHNNKDNIIVKTAIESDYIQTYKKTKSNIGFKDIMKLSFKEDTGMIDTRKYFDTEKIINHYNNLEKLLAEYNSKKPQESSEQFFATIKRLKRGAIINNIGGSILVLGVITPTVMVLKRLLSPNDKEFCRKKEIREQMLKNGEIVA